MTTLIAEVARIAWFTLAFAFVVAVAYGIVRGRRRSQRLFVDRPNAILATLKHDTTHQHEQDAWL